MKKKERFVDLERYPVERSASGENAYYLEQCSVTNSRPSYAACLKRVADRKQGRLATEFADCSAAIGKKSCPAQAMQRAEQEAGYALYFIPRLKLLEHSDQQMLKRGIDMKVNRSAPLSTTPPAIIRPAVVAQVQEEVVRRPVVARTPMQPNETPLEYARRVAGVVV
ncbi:hypothetical protein PQQ87_08825 [Paraburkholderia nemoris]|uniref:hypothetical protein n=1 Tax=Paraburkholderia nemoris TaxID=2793076 RepID=UPI0038BA7C55